jgi:hypothetical protein
LVVFHNEPVAKFYPKVTGKGIDNADGVKFRKKFGILFGVTCQK